MKFNFVDCAVLSACIVATVWNAPLGWFAASWSVLAAIYYLMFRIAEQKGEG